MKIVYLVRRLWHYHLARLSYFNESLRAENLRAGRELFCIETRPDCNSGYVDPDAASKAPPVGVIRAARLLEELEILAPDVLVLTGYSDAAMLRALAWGLDHRVPAVLVSDTNQFDWPRRIWREWGKRQLLKCFSAAFVAGKNSRDYLARLGFNSQAIFAPCNVIDSERFGREQQCESEFEGGPLPHSFFLSVMRLAPEKGALLLLKAYAQARRERPDGFPDLVLVGSGPLEQELRRFVAANNLDSAVRLLGAVENSNLPALYQRALAFVLPSFSECWGLVVNEALAGGCPVIVSSHCGCAFELAQEAGTGIVFESGDEKALAQALRQACGWQDANRAALQAAAKRVMQNYSLEKYWEGFFAASRFAEESGAKPAPLLATVILKLLNLFLPAR